MRSPYIRIATAEASFVVYQPVGLSFWNYGNLKRAYGTATSKWQLEAADYLAARVSARG
jgi:hypothetical protein